MSLLQNKELLDTAGHSLQLVHLILFPVLFCSSPRYYEFDRDLATLSTATSTMVNLGTTQSKTSLLVGLPPELQGLVFNNVSASP